jgi:hypothetical protein
MHEGPTNNHQILYAQALQIAMLLAGNTNTQNPLSTAFPQDLLVETELAKYRKLTLSVLRYLRAQ